MEVRRGDLTNWALRTSPKFTTGLNISSIRDFDQIRDPEILITLRPLFVIVVVVLGFTTLLTSQIISVAFYSEREKSDKFCSEALISA